ncbi:MAG: hypothetical protein IPG71_02455 [bacterium]|nr:hypothetical protein [bacterium]
MCCTWFRRSLETPLRETHLKTGGTPAAPALTLLLVVFALLVFGCAGKRTLLMEQVRTELRNTSAQQALAAYEKGVKKNTQRVDELLNLGLLALEAGEYDKALGSLKEADRIAEERLTKSLSREAASLTTSDRVRAYQGTVYDKAILHYYQALAYLGKGEPDAAVVEGRRIASYLEVNARESKHSYKDDPFLQWFSGAMYETYGQHNDAWISYKRALELYPFYGIEEPGYLCRATYAALKEVGASEQEAALLERCGDVDKDVNPDWGRVVVLCETGIAPQILENNLMFPIMKYDRRDFKDDDERSRYSEELWYRGHDYEYEESELDYFVRVALPYYPEGYAGTETRRVSVRGEGIDKLAELAAPLGSILRQDLNDRMPAIAARAITRGIIKYAASKAAEDAGKKDSEALGTILGLGVNLLGAATEAADTRSWETLPDQIFVADFQLPPGEHELRVIYEDAGGMTLTRYDLPKVTVRAGELKVMRARCWK